MPGFDFFTKKKSSSSSNATGNTSLPSTVNAFNKRSVSFEEIEKKHEENLKIALQDSKIATYEEEQQRVDAILEFIQTTREVLKRMQASSAEQPRTAIQWQKDYLDGIEEKINQLTEARKNLLNARDQIFIDGELVPITKELKQQLLQDFSRDLHTEFQTWILTVGPTLAFSRFVNVESTELTPVEISQILKTLNNQFGVYFEAFNRLFTEKTSAAGSVADVVEKYEKTRSDIARAAKEEMGQTVFVTNCIRENISDLEETQEVTQQELDQAFYEVCRLGKIQSLLCLFEAKRRWDKTPNPTVQNELGFTGCHCAVQNGHIETLGLLQENWHHLGRTDRLVDIRSRRGHTLLHTAAYVEPQQPSIALSLCEWGIDCEAREEIEGGTAMHTAAQRGHLLVMGRLLYMGCDPLALNKHEETVLEVALLYRQVKILMFFSDQGFILTKTQIDATLNKVKNNNADQTRETQKKILEIVQSVLTYQSQRCCAMLKRLEQQNTGNVSQDDDSKEGDEERQFKL